MEKSYSKWLRAHNCLWTLYKLLPVSTYEMTSFLKDMSTGWYQATTTLKTYMQNETSPLFKLPLTLTNNPDYSLCLWYIHQTLSMVLHILDPLEEHDSQCKQCKQNGICHIDEGLGSSQEVDHHGYLADGVHRVGGAPHTAVQRTESEQFQGIGHTVLASVLGIRLQTPSVTRPRGVKERGHLLQLWGSPHRTVGALP